MSLARFIGELEEAVANISVEQRYVLAALLRQAAIRLRNSNGIAIESALDQALRDIAAALGEPMPDLISRILWEWLEQHSYAAARVAQESGRSEGICDFRHFTEGTGIGFFVSEPDRCPSAP